MQSLEYAQIEKPKGVKAGYKLPIIQKAKTPSVSFAIVAWLLLDAPKCLYLNKFL